MNEYNPPRTKTESLKYGGHMSQFAGIRRNIIFDGRARGVEALDFDNGTGLKFTVLPDRNMDICSASYKGVPICYVTKNGLSSAANYEAEGAGWLRNFFAGLLTTCGLSNVGGSCEDVDPEVGKVRFGAHGRINNIGADNVCYEAKWVTEDKFSLEASGRMREAVLNCENLSLTRKIYCEMGKNAIKIHDIVENEGFDPRPLTILYHINAGYPILCSDSRLILPTAKIIPATDNVKGHEDWYNKFDEPAPCVPEKLFFHELRKNENGISGSALVNDKLGLGLYVKFDANALNRFVQWNKFSCGDYVVGMEPANTYAIGRVNMKNAGLLQYIAPREKREFDVEIGVLDGAQQIAQFEKEMNF